MKKAVIYARYSSAKQNEQSIEGQLEACLKYAKENDFFVVKQYIDRKQSGRTDKRFEFQKMITDAYSKNFDFIIVYQYDRFSRNRRHSINYKYELSKLGINIISITEPMMNSPEKIFLEGFLENIAEYYVLDLSRKVKRGMAETLKKRNSMGGTQILGYAVKDKKIVLDPEHIKTVNYIFNAVADGLSRLEIINELNVRGIKTSRGNAFTTNSLQHMLKNRKYVGEYETSDGIIYDYYPRIVTDELFDKVQKRLIHNQKVGGGMKRTNEKYLLTGKAFCGICGSPLVGVSTVKNQTKKYTYYACSNSFKHHTCDKKNTSKAQFEEMVVDLSINYILDPKRSSFIVDNMYKELVKSAKQSGAGLNDLIKRKNAHEKELNKIYEKFKNTSSQILIKKLNDEADVLGGILENIEKEIIIEQNKIKKTPSKEELIYWLYSHAVGDIKDERFRTRIFNHLVNQVFLFNDKVVVYFNIEHSRTISLAELQADLADGNLAHIERECSYGEYNGEPCGLACEPIYIFKAERLGVIVSLECSV